MARPFRYHVMRFDDVKLTWYCTMRTDILGDAEKRGDKVWDTANELQFHGWAP